jgi:hypothetical protein
MAAIARIIAQTLALALSLYALMLAAGAGWVGGHRLHERLAMVSAGYFLIVAGTLMAAWHRRPLLAAAIVLVPLAWTNNGSLHDAQVWLNPGLAGVLIGTACQLLSNERKDAWRTSSTTHRRTSDALPTPKPEPIASPASVAKPSSSPTTASATSASNREISPRTTAPSAARQRQN